MCVRVVVRGVGVGVGGIYREVGEVFGVVFGGVVFFLERVDWVLILGIVRLAMTLDAAGIGKGFISLEGGFLIGLSRVLYLFFMDFRAGGRERCFMLRVDVDVVVIVIVRLLRFWFLVRVRFLVVYAGFVFSDGYLFLRLWVRGFRGVL